MTLRSLMQAGPAKANELFAKLSETSDGAVKTRERLFAELKAELEFHTSLEEQHLFPVLRRNPETKDLVADAIRDNKELRAKVAELDGMAKNDAIFSERLSELQKVFRQHARDDRKELLPAVQRALSEEQVQGVTDKMEAGIAEAEQAKQDEAEERRAKARQEREEAEFLARQAELREQEDAKAEREQAAAEQRVRAQARQVADAALKPVAAMAKAVDEAARQTNATFGAEAGRTQSPALALTNMFIWPWLARCRRAAEWLHEGTRRVRHGGGDPAWRGGSRGRQAHGEPRHGTHPPFRSRNPDRAAGHAAEREGGGGAPSASERQGHRRDPDRGHGGNR